MFTFPYVVSVSTFFVLDIVHIDMTGLKMHFPARCPSARQIFVFHEGFFVSAPHVTLTLQDEVMAPS